jgi:hypothetical protein
MQTGSMAEDAAKIPRSQSRGEVAQEVGHPVEVAIVQGALHLGQVGDYHLVQPNPPVLSAWYNSYLKEDVIDISQMFEWYT